MLLLSGLLFLRSVAGSDFERPCSFEFDGLNPRWILSTVQSDATHVSDPELDAGDETAVCELVGDVGGGESSLRIRLKGRSDGGFDSLERFVGAGIATVD